MQATWQHSTRWAGTPCKGAGTLAPTAFGASAWSVKRELLVAL